MALKDSFDMDSILYRILNESSVKGMISGDIYAGERPLNSEKEDIAINVLTITQDSTPQTGVSNVNIFVPDIDVKISGRTQKVENRKRISTLTKEVLSILRAAKITGISLSVESQNTIAEPDISQHFSNIKIFWNILIN